MLERGSRVDAATIGRRLVEKRKMTTFVEKVKGGFDVMMVLGGSD